MQLPIEEYFRYHPPTTPERIALHDRVNKEMLKLCHALICCTPMDKEQIAKLYQQADQFSAKVCKDATCLKWARNGLQYLSIAALTDSNDRDEAILMRVQQIRMFLNQGITVDELVKNQGEK